MFVERRVISGNHITWKSKATSFVSRTDIVGIGISRLTRISTWGSAPGFLSLWGFRRKHGTRSLEPLVTYDCLGRTPGSTERGFSGLTVDLRLFCENRPWPPRKSPGETLLSTPPPLRCCCRWDPSRRYGPRDEYVRMYLDPDEVGIESWT